MRHAKSDWDTDAPDFDRPLNKRGMREAPEMGRYLESRKLIPNLILASPATRAKTTALLVAENCGFDAEISWQPAFYHEDQTVLPHIIRKTEETIQTLLLIGHNPTWEIFASQLAGQFIEMKTSTMACFRIETEFWSKFTVKNAHLEWVTGPKNIPDTK